MTWIQTSERSKGRGQFEMGESDDRSEERPGRGGNSNGDGMRHQISSDLISQNSSGFVPHSPTELFGFLLGRATLPPVSSVRVLASKEPISPGMFVLLVTAVFLETRRRRRVFFH